MNWTNAPIVTHHLENVHIITVFENFLTQISAFTVTGWLLYRSIISGERYMGVVLRWI